MDTRDQIPASRIGRTVRTRPVPASIAAHDGRFTDPLWGVTVSLSPLELDLLRSAPVRRLHFVAHAGGSSITTLQTYSRLEHSLGVLALVAHFRPDDDVLRATALLHDVGHLPFSHTLEGLAGLDHHELSDRLISSGPLADRLTSHGMDPASVIDLLSAADAAGWGPPPGLLGLDHLDSYVRSARSGARLGIDPARLLARLNLVGGAVDTDRDTAETLVRLVCDEALLHTSWESIAPSAALRHLVQDLLDRERLTPGQLARLTDAQLWSALDADPVTHDDAERLRLAPHLLRTAVDQGEPEPVPAWEFSLRKIYVSAPLINSRTLEMAAPELARRLDETRALPTAYRAWWQERAGQDAGDHISPRV